MLCTNRAVALACILVAAACTTPFKEMPPSLPNDFNGIPLNAGRVHAIAIHPQDQNTAIISMQFGGLWRTTDGGATWRHLRGLNKVFVRDVAYGEGGETVIATLGRTMHASDQLGGIMISQNGGTSWSRPVTGAVPSDSRTPVRGEAYGISKDPDVAGGWYVGTSFGIARSADDGVTWTHVKVTSAGGIGRNRLQDHMHAVLAFPGGSVLAMGRNGVFRSDSNGASGTWTNVRNESFSFYEGMGINKMDRSPFYNYAFIIKDYDTLYFYNLYNDEWDEIPLPEGGGSRSPYVRIGKPNFSGRYITIWVGQGLRSLYVTRRRSGSIKALQADDWQIVGRGEGVHDDTGDLGLNADYKPVFLGSDGGIFKPSPVRPVGTSPYKIWVSAARPGSGMNSYQITDLAGLNDANDETARPVLHFSTQDNAIWSSDDGGATWPNFDCAEGFHLEGPRVSSQPQIVTMAYGRVGCGYSNSRMSDPHLVNKRNVGDDWVGGGRIESVDSRDNETKTDAGQAFYLKPDRWIRIRAPRDGSNREVLLSTDDGATWRKRYELEMRTYGIFKRTKAHYPASYMKAYLPVGDGANNPDGSPRIGLIRLFNMFQNTTSTIGTAGVMTLPDGGSLGRRATEFDWQAVYGVHPKQWRLVYAPDIVNQRVMVTRDGGRTWSEDRALTRLATDNGVKRLWDGRESRMGITAIDFDPYREERILVGTRDEGILCSDDSGETWGRIKRSERILYPTAFHFMPSGETWVSSYGRGLWKLKSRTAACVNGMPSDSIPNDPPIAPGVTIGDAPGVGGGPSVLNDAGPLGAVDGFEFDEEDGSTPNSANIDGQPFLTASTSVFSMSGTVLGEDNGIVIVAKGFGSTRNIRVRLNGEIILPKALQRGRREAPALLLQVPEDLPYGEHALVVTGADGEEAVLTFRKIHLERHLGEEERTYRAKPEMTLKELEVFEAQFPLSPEERAAERPSINPPNQPGQKNPTRGG